MSIKIYTIKNLQREIHITLPLSPLTVTKKCIFQNAKWRVLSTTEGLALNKNWIIMINMYASYGLGL
jgi:hypothetical protein